MFTGIKLWWWLRELKSKESYDRKMAAKALGNLGDKR